MYLLTDVEEDNRTPTTNELSLVNELKAIIFGVVEEEREHSQTHEAEQWK